MALLFFFFPDSVPKAERKRSLGTRVTNAKLREKILALKINNSQTKNFKNCRVFQNNRMVDPTVFEFITDIEEINKMPASNLSKQLSAWSNVSARHNEECRGRTTWTAEKQRANLIRFVREDEME